MDQTLIMLRLVNYHSLTWYLERELPGIPFSQEIGMILIPGHLMLQELVGTTLAAWYQADLQRK